MKKGFKGFNKDLKCLNFQYEIGKEYKTDKKPVRCTENGFHFCENPIDVFKYYAPSESRFAEVEGFGEISTDEKDSKVAVSKIKIGAEINLHRLIESGIKFIFERTTLTKTTTNSESAKQASNSGNRGAASNSGNSGAASNSGYSGAASNSGDRGAASNSGYSGAASNSGDSGAALTTGSYSSAETLNENSFACALGYNSKVKGVLNSWITLAEYNKDYKIICVKSARIDGKKLKADTWYILKDKKISED
jgi:hypothetical protein